MKKKCLMVLIAIALMIVVAGCTTEKSEISTEKSVKNSLFEVVERKISWVIVYHTETKVMYAISDGYYKQGAFTLLVDAEGNPLLWQE